jgi:oligoribonuclease (3'-5' exoribonuclease)
MKPENLKLNKSLIFFDLESTGTDTRRDRIVELSTIKITPDGKQEIITQRLLWLPILLNYIIHGKFIFK